MIFRIYIVYIAIILLCASFISANSYDGKISISRLDKYIEDDNLDHTSLVQAIIDRSDTIIFPEFQLLINQDGLTIESDKHLIFGENSSIKFIGNDLEVSEVIRLHGVKNVTIENPVIIGDRIDHHGTKGEWGMGIAIRGSSNIKILNPSISDCWGDGIYIGKLNSSYSSNVSIENVDIINCRRNGISIVSGKDITIYKGSISSSNGTAPMAGIDIEPNNNDDVVDNIKILHVNTCNNFGAGIQIALNKLLLGNKRISSSILIEDFSDFNSKIGIFVGRMASEKYPFSSIDGRIEFKNTVLSANRQPIKYGDNLKQGPRATIYNLVINHENLNYSVDSFSKRFKDIDNLEIINFK